MKPFSAAAPFLLVPLLNLGLLVLAVLLAPPGKPDQYFRETEFLTWLNSAQLFLAGVLGVMIWERGRSGDQRSERFWLLAGIILLYLAADEFLQYHEHLGLWLERHTALRAPRWIGPLDNLILLLYAVLIGLVGVAGRRQLLATPVTLAILLSGGMTMAASQVVDGLTSGLLFRRSDGLAFLWAQVGEESLKMLATSLVLAGLLHEFWRSPVPLHTGGLPHPADRPRRFGGLITWLFALHLAWLLFGLVQGVAADDLKLLLGRRNVLTWWSSLEQAAVASLLALACWQGGRSVPEPLPRGAVGLGALAVAVNALLIYFGPRDPATILGVSPQDLRATWNTAAVLVAATVIRLGRRQVSALHPFTRRWLVAWLTLVLLGALLVAASDQPFGRPSATRLETAAFCAGYLASFCLLAGVLTWWRSPVRGAAQDLPLPAVGRSR